MRKLRMLPILVAAMLVGCFPPKIEISPPKISPTVSVTGAATSLSRLTVGGPHEHGPNLSPDGQWFLIHAAPSDGGRTVLQKINLQTGSRVILTPSDSNNGMGDWMPDQRSIVFVTDRLGVNSLVQSFGVTGEVAVRFITPASLNNIIWPEISPDGSQVAFSISKPPGDNLLSIIDIDGRNLRHIGNGWAARWTHDGEQIAFTRLVGNFVQIFTMDSETGSNLTQLTSENSNNYGPSWSPDGEYISFTSDRVSGYRHLFIMNKDGQEIIQLTNGHFDCAEARWAADWYIYFSSNASDNWDIWRLKPIFQSN